MKLSSCLFFLIITLQAAAQPAGVTAELEKIKQLPDDTAKVNKLNTLAAANFASNPEATFQILNISTAIAEKINYPLGASVAYGSRSSQLFYQMKLDSSLLLLNKAFNLVKDGKEISYINQQANLQNKYGAILQQQQLYDTAIKKYLLAAELYRKTNNEQLAIVCYYNISVMYGFLTEPAKALFYARQVQRIAHNTANPEFLQRSNIIMGDAFAAAKQYDSLWFYVQQGFALAGSSAGPFITGKLQQQRGIYFLKEKQNFAAARLSFDSALVQFEKINLPFEKAAVYQNTGNAYLQQKDYTNAAKYASLALDLCKQFAMDQLTLSCLADLAAAEDGLGEPNKSNEYLRQFLALKDTLDQRNKNKLVNELEAKYQSEKKEILLLEQQNTITQKNTLNYILMGSALTLLIISMLSYRNYRQKQQLQQQRISELETEKQLAATGAVLKGEEQERTRLARDLHDGLGGMLSGIKYSFQNMKGSLVMTPDNALAFERSIDMLDSSIQEMRRVAHNLMPETLVKFGLDASLKDFCNSINQTGVIQVIYQSIGMENVELGQTTSISIYRIVQELVNNTVKHAAAKQAIVQVSKRGENISITVEDDGKGFDTVILQSARGIGWSNIRGRVDYLKGDLDIKSLEGKGTSVHIELKIG